MEDRNGFSHNFKSPVGKQRRPACPVHRPHRGCHRLLDWGRRCEYKPLPDRLGRQWQKWWERACILHGKQNWVTGLAWRIILVQWVKPSPLLQCDTGCDVELATQLLLFQERQSCLSALSKRGKNPGGEQGEPSRFSFHFLSFPFAHEPLCLASWKPDLSPINGDGPVLRAWAACLCTERAHRGSQGKPRRVTNTRNFIPPCKVGLGTLHDIGATAPMPPRLGGPHWRRQWCWPTVITQEGKERWKAELTFLPCKVGKKGVWKRFLWM